MAKKFCWMLSSPAGGMEYSERMPTNLAAHNPGHTPYCVSSSAGPTLSSHWLPQQPPITAARTQRKLEDTAMSRRMTGFISPRAWDADQDAGQGDCREETPEHGDEATHRVGARAKPDPAASSRMRHLDRHGGCFELRACPLWNCGKEGQGAPACGCPVPADRFWRNGGVCL